MKYAAAFALALIPALVLAQDPTDQLAGYKEADAVQKLVMLSVASTDKVMTHKQVTVELAKVVQAEVNKGKDAGERLQIHGKLRADAQAALKEVNKKRKADKKRFASFREPESYFQQALALDYLVAAAGPKPTLEKLECLKLIRETTSWTAHGNLVLASLVGAFNSDEGYVKADMKGRLEMIKAQSERGLMSDQERTHLERPVITEWLVAELSAGKTVEDVGPIIAELKGSKHMCFFTSSWINGILKRLAEFPADAKAITGPDGTESGK